MAHTLKDTIDLAVKTAILRAHPIGSYYLTEGDENPADFIGGGNRLKSLVIQASDDTHAAGTTAEAGLPDITGDLRVVGDSEGGKWNANMHGGGAFYDRTVVSGTQYYARVTTNTNDGTYNLGFQASKSNAIYGRSTTVKPPARFVNVWKRVS